MTFRQFKKLQLKERNEFFADAIAEHKGNLHGAARALGMRHFVLARHVKLHGLIANYGDPIRRKWATYGRTAHRCIT
jgi:hypothetical protein